MGLNGAGVITVAEWFNFCVEHIIAKAATFTTHIILVQKNADSDTNKDGLVNRESFSKFVDMATSIPRIYGYVPTNVELHKTEDEKEQARRKTFDFIDFKGTDMITVDEWFKFCVKNIAKAATFAAHPILDHRPDHTEMFWFLLELSTESDPNENGTFILARLNPLILANMDRGMMSDGSRAVSPPAKADNGRQGTFLQYGGYFDGLRDVSQLDDAANDRQGTLPQHEDHHGGSRDVSPLDDADNGHQGTLSQHEDKDLHGAKERGQEEKVVTQ